MGKVIAFEVKVAGITQTLNNFGEVKTLIAKIKQDLDKTDFGSAKYNELQKTLGTLKQTYKAVNDETRAQQQASIKAAETGKNSYRALNAELVLLRKSFKDLSEEEAEGNIGKSLLANINILDAKLKNIDAKMGLFQRNVGNYQGALQTFFGAASGVLNGPGGQIGNILSTGVINGAASALSGNLVGAFLAVGTAVAAAGSEVIKFNAEITDLQADIQKTTGLTTGRIQELTEQFKTLDTRTSLKGLLGIATVLGQIGVEVNNNTVSAVDKLSVALGDDFGGGTEVVTKEVGELRNVLAEFKNADPETAFLNIGNALNVLSASGLSTAPVISDFSTRIAGMSGTFGVAAGEILGVSATLQELGTTAERGATGFSRVIGELVKQPEEFAKQLGLSTQAIQEVDASAQNFTDLVNKDLFGAFTVVLDRVNELNLANTDLSNIFEALQINGQGEIEVLTKLASNQDLLAKRVATANKALGSQDSILAEFTAKNTTLAAELDKLGNIIVEGFVDSGFSDFLRDVVAGVNDWFDADVQLSDQMVDQQIKMNTLIYTINDVNTSTDERIALIRQLQQEYPEFFSNLDAEKASNEQLNAILQEVNETYAKRIAIIKNNETIQEAQADVGEKINEVEFLRARLFRDLNENAIKYNQTAVDQIKLTGDLAKDVALLNSVGAGWISWTRDLTGSLGALTRAERELKDLQGETNKASLLTLEVNANIAKTGGIINEQKVQELITLSSGIEARKEEIKQLIASGRASEAAAKALKIREEAQKAVNSVSKEGLDIVIKSTTGPIQLLAANGKKAADTLRTSIAEIDKIIKGSGTAPTTPPTSSEEKKAQRLAEEQLEDLKKQQEATLDSLLKYQQKRIDAEGKFGKRIADLGVKNIKDQSERELAAENERYTRSIEQAMQENEALIKLQNDAERELAEAIAKAEEIRDKTTSSKTRNAAIQQIKDLQSQRKTLETQIAQDNLNRQALLNENLERLQTEHGNNINEIIKKSAERDKAEFEKRQKENFKAVDEQFGNFEDGLERQFKDREIAINKARKEALDALNNEAPDDIAEKLEEINTKFDAEEANSKIQLLTEKLQSLRTELGLIQAVNLQDISNGVSPSFSQDDIQKVKDQIQDTEKEITAIEVSESDKRVQNKTDEVKKKLELEKEYREQLRDTLLDVANAAADSLLNIEANRLDDEISREEEAIKKKYDKRVELANGNSFLIEQVERQRALALEELDKKRAREEQQLAKTRARIEGALAIVKAYATLGPIAATIAAAGIIATTALQIAEIDSQSFAAGGYTPNIGGTPDETGEVPVKARLHAGEYVIPRRVLRTPRGAQLAREAEIMRTGMGYPSRPGSFAVGGYVPIPTSSSQSQAVVVNATTQLDPDQFRELVNQLREAVLEGATEGTIIGNDQSNRSRDRQASLKSRTEV